jgi:phospholipid transport system substrate-binding protein
MLSKIIKVILVTNIALLAINIQANQYSQGVYQDRGYQNHQSQNSGPQNSGPQNNGPQNNGPQNNRPAQNYKASPVEILESSINNVLDFLAQSNSENVNKLRSYVNREISPNFDFDYMSRWVAGKRYYMMNEEQKVEFKNKFTDIFLSTFIEKTTKNRSSLPRVSRFMSKRYSENEARASVMLGYSNRTQVRIDFRFIKIQEDWKVVDVKANGISALMYFRNYFANLMRANKKSHSL